MFLMVGLRVYLAKSSGYHGVIIRKSIIERGLDLHFNNLIVSMSEAQTSVPPGLPEKSSPQKDHVKPPFLVPSPIVTRRTRTTSVSRLASDSPLKKGVITEFECGKGHGFIKPDDGGPTIFVHVSDIEGEYVPHRGDGVEYRECPIPPKRDKVQAVEVVLTSLNTETKHVRWGMTGSS